MTPATLLIDLDDTLITNPQESFMPAYINLLSARLAKYTPPQKMVPQLLYATDQMLLKDSPAQTLEDVFDQNFYPQLGIEKKKVSAEIDAFYAQDFTTLKHAASLRSDARDMVDYAVSRGHTLVVATNPLFPMTAMRTRLTWGGYERVKNPFRYVTSYENMHFAKPNLAYYAEILGVLGWPCQPVGMIGNSLRDDILPVANLGFPAYWLEGEPYQIPDHVQNLVTVGSLKGIQHWIDSLESNAIILSPKSNSAILAVLKSTPAVLQQLTRNLTEDDWRRNKPSNSKSVLESISHLLDFDLENNIPGIQNIITHENPTIQGVDSDAWLLERNYNQGSTQTVIEEFTQSRTILLNLLTRLDEHDWQRSAQHANFGSTTLLEFAGAIAAQDQEYVRRVFDATKII
jgi:FMN phosphatase YigB (HAD superfamily)